MSPVPVYRIRIQGLLSHRWDAWFEGLTVDLDKQCGETVLTGPVADQSALHGILEKIRDLNLPLISVERIFPSA